MLCGLGNYHGDKSKVEVLLNVFEQVQAEKEKTRVEQFTARKKQFSYWFVQRFKYQEILNRAYGGLFTEVEVLSYLISQLVQHHTICQRRCKHLVVVHVVKNNQNVIQGHSSSASLQNDITVWKFKSQHASGTKGASYSIGRITRCGNLT